jgi:hypothetical protein
MSKQMVEFVMQKISILDHLISPAVVRIDPERTRAIREFSSPRQVKGISRMLVMDNFFHKFIPRLADLSAPINSLR